MNFKLTVFLLSFSFFTFSTITLKAQTKDTLSFEEVLKVYYKKDYETAMTQLLQLRERYTKEGNQLMLGRTYRRIGLTFKINKEYKKARLNYFKALKFTKKKGIEKLNLYNNIASLNYQEKHLDSSIYYYQKILKDTSFNKYEDEIAFTNKNLSGIYTVKKEIALALKHITIAMIFYNKENNPKELIKLYNNAASIYYANEDYKTAIKEYEKAYTLLNDSTDISVRKSITINLMRSNYILGNTKEARKLDSIKEVLLDSIQNLEFNEKITEIEAIHNKDKARAEEKVNTLKAEKAQERMQYMLAGTGLASVVIILFGSVLYRNSKLKAKNLSLSLVEQELNQQKTLRVLQEKNQSKLLNATLDGRETERKEIAQTLHDSVSALLSSANMHLQVVKKKSTGAVAELDKSQRIIDEASGKVRDLSHKLISAVLLKFGLEHAVYDMCEKYSNQDLEFELESEDKIPRFEQDFEIKIHNIIEECINNIMKHSKASEASVFLLLTNNTLHITIKDNGVGFDASKISPSSGIGLSQIKARIENMQGVFYIDSKPNKGTSIAMQVPVKNI